MKEKKEKREVWVCLARGKDEKKYQKKKNQTTKTEGGGSNRGGVQGEGERPGKKNLRLRGGGNWGVHCPEEGT